MARFAQLPAALAELSAQKRTSIERLRAAARGEQYAGRLATTKVEQVASTAAKAPARKSTPAASSTPAKSPPPKPEQWTVPAEIAAKGPAVSHGYRIVFGAVTDQLSRMSSLPRAQASIGSLMRLVAANMSDVQIKAQLPNEPTDRQRQISAMWDDAVMSVCGTRDSKASDRPLGAEAIAGTETRPTDEARARLLAVASSSAFIGREGIALKMLTKPTMLGLSAEDAVDVLATLDRYELSADGGRVLMPAAAGSASSLHPAWAAALKGTTH
jgi:hypothetical protein